MLFRSHRICFIWFVTTKLPRLYAKSLHSAKYFTCKIEQCYIEPDSGFFYGVTPINPQFYWGSLTFCTFGAALSVENPIFEIIFKISFVKPTDPFFPLKESLDGDVFTDQVQRVIYATDASSYREIPQAVTRPKNKEDIRKIIAFARQTGTSVIPRAGGTSLAGQVVGPGIVVDISKYLNKIGELNIEQRWIEVEPGVVLAELNQFLSKLGLQFAPETSTANRCCIGGMLGNNSCGLHSLI